MASEIWGLDGSAPIDDHVDQADTEISNLDLYHGLRIRDSGFARDAEVFVDGVATSAEAGEGIHTAFWEVRDAEPSPPLFAHATRHRPIEVPGYEILGELGRGGMGVVYQARQIRLNRLVALKMILPGDHAGPGALERLLAEAETIARIKHPNIVQIYAIGDSGGLPYVELEFVEGGSLASRLDGAPWSPRSAARLIECLARALTEAHRLGIVHRDLKPANILMSAGGAPKISDFGLAKSIEDEPGMMGSGTIIGSPRYMAPEQAEGGVTKVGPAADLYALGAILYELLTGRPPFVASTVFATLELVKNREPVAPRRLQPRVPRDLEALCLKCLEKEPHERYPSAEALAEDLDGFLNERPIRVRRPPPWERTIRWVKRRPTLAALILVSAMAILSSTGTWVWHEAEVARQARIVRLRGAALRDQARNFILLGEEAVRRDDWEAARTQSSSALAVARAEPDLVGMRHTAERMLALSSRSIALQKSREAARERYTRFLQLHDEAVFYQSDYTGMDTEANLGSARSSARKALAQYGLDRRDQHGLKLDPGHFKPQEVERIVDGCYELTLLLAEAESQPLKGEDPVHQAIAALDVLDGIERIRTPTPAYYLRRASYLQRLGNQAGAEEQRRLAETASASASGSPSIDDFLIGQQAYRKGDLKAAAAALQRALSRRPDHFWAQYLLAACHLRAHRPGEALAALIACQSRRPRFVWTYLLKGFAEGEMGEFDLAETDFRRADELGLNNQERYVMLVNRGVMRVRRGRKALAIEDLCAAIALKPDHYQAYVNLAQAYETINRCEDALATLDRAIAIAPNEAVLYRARSQVPRVPAQPGAVLDDLDRAIAHSAPDDPALAGDYVERGLMLQQACRLAEALAACDRALQLDPDRSEAHRLRGVVLIGLKRYEDAIGSFDVCIARGKAPQAIYEARGLARAWSGAHERAVADYTMALNLGRGSPSLYASRGWSYLLSRAPAPALRDFDNALHLDPSNGHALSGRAQAYVQLRKPSEAVADAQSSVRLSPSDARSFYNAARVLCQAAVCLEADPSRAGGGWADARRYRAEALEYLGRAQQLYPEPERSRFWQEVVRPDLVLEPLRRTRKFAELDARVARTQNNNLNSNIKVNHDELVAPAPSGPRS